MAQILIVDDQPDTCEMLGHFLTDAGHQVTSAANGWEALLAVESAEPDLILLDIMMPGMDGPTFLKILRHQKRVHHLPVIIVSAFHESEAAERARKLGVEGFLPKTNRLLDQLIETVEGILAKREDTPRGGGSPN